jgi:predicted MFS family arabinose efflux permease
VTSPIGASRDFRLLWVGGLAAATGAQMSSVGLPLLVLRHTGSPVLAGAVGTVSLATLVITMLPGGALADRAERRRLMLSCDLLSAAVTGAFAVAVLAGRVPVLLALAVAVVGALIASVYIPASFGLLRSIVPDEQVGQATARLQARSATARLAGPAAGGALFAWHPALPFAAETAGLLISAACLLLMRTRSRPAPGPAGPSKGGLTAGVRFLWRQPYLRTALLVFGVGMNSGFAALSFVALAVASRGGQSGLGGGIVVSLGSVGALAGSLLAPRLSGRLRSGTMIALTCWASAAAAGILAIRRDVLLMGGLVAVCLAVAAVASVGFVAALVVSSPPDATGRVQSAAGFLSSVAQPVGPLLGGFLLARWGPGPAFAVLGAVFAVCAVIITWAPSIRRESRRPAVGQAQPAAAPAAAPVREG